MILKKYYYVLWLLIPILVIGGVIFDYINSGKVPLSTTILIIPIAALLFILGFICRFIEAECKNPQLLYIVRIALIVSIISSLIGLVTTAVISQVLVFGIWIYMFVPYAQKSYKAGAVFRNIIMPLIMGIAIIIFGSLFYFAFTVIFLKKSLIPA